MSPRERPACAGRSFCIRRSAVEVAGQMECYSIAPLLFFCTIPRITSSFPLCPLLCPSPCPVRSFSRCLLPCLRSLFLASSIRCSPSCSTTCLIRCLRPCFSTCPTRCARPCLWSCVVTCLVTCPRPCLLPCFTGNSRSGLPRAGVSAMSAIFGWLAISANTSPEMRRRREPPIDPAHERARNSFAEHAQCSDNRIQTCSFHEIASSSDSSQ
jgi:hypothetical protein